MRRRRRRYERAQEEVVRKRVLPPVRACADVPRAPHEGDTEPAAHERAEWLLRGAAGGDGEQRERVLRRSAGDEKQTRRRLRERAPSRGGAEPNDVRLDIRSRERAERDARLLMFYHASWFVRAAVRDTKRVMDIVSPRGRDAPVAFEKEKCSFEKAA